MSEIDENRPSAKSPEDASRRAIAEWLRDADEIDELLAQLGGEVSDEPKENRKRLLAIVKHEPPEVVASHMYRLASGFAAMLDDITQACDDWKISIAGEMLLDHARTLGRSSALDTSWARDENGKAVLQGTHVFPAIADQLRAACNALRGAKLVHKRSEKVLNDVGQVLAEHPDPGYRAMVEIKTSATHTRRDHVEASSDDVHRLRACVGLVSQLQKSATLLRDGSVIGALSQLSADIRSKLLEIEGLSMGHAAPSSSVLQAQRLLLELTSLLPSAARQTVRAIRAMRGMGAFVKSELWKSRWRLYEVWVLIRCLRTVERAGFELELLGVEDGVWLVHYGQSTEPIARAHAVTGALVLNLFYQLFDRGELDTNGNTEARKKAAKVNAMPDIAVQLEGGRYIFVVDPKHGPSHRLSSVRGVLDRYADRFSAIATAVVNYTDVEQYRFIRTREATPEASEKILASGVVPGSIAARRLELCLEEAILSQLPSTGILGRHDKPAPRAVPKRTSALVYWATEDNEVDEPSGAWMLGNAGELQHLSKLSGLVAEHKKVQFFSTNHSGSTCLVVTDKELIFLSEVDVRRVEFNAGYKPTVTSWCRCGAHALAISPQQWRVFSIDGLPVADLPTNDQDASIAWSDDCRILYLVTTNGTVFTLHMDAARPQWIKSSQRGSNYSSRRIVYDSTNRQYLLEHRGYGRNEPYTTEQLVVGDQPKLVVCETRGDELLAVSPTGERKVVRGPDSLRKSTLFKVVDLPRNEQVGPLIRVPGSPSGEVKWSLDGDRFSFMAGSQIFLCAPGEKYGIPVAMYGHHPIGFGWFNAALIRRWS